MKEVMMNLFEKLDGSQKKDCVWATWINVYEKKIKDLINELINLTKEASSFVYHEYWDFYDIESKNLSWRVHWKNPALIEKTEEIIKCLEERIEKAKRKKEQEQKVENKQNEINIESKAQKELEELQKDISKGLLDWLCKFGSPHTTILITQMGIKVVDDRMFYPFKLRN